MMNKTILIVDDSPLSFEIIQDKFIADGFNIIRAVNGIDAIEAAYTHAPDLIILDVNMPMIKGYQVSRVLKSRRGVITIPIIIHTSNNEIKDKFWSYNSGANAYIEKNYNNLDPLCEMATKLMTENPVNKGEIAMDAKDLNRDKIIEYVSDLLDQDLFHSTIQNQLSEASRSFSSVTSTIYKVLDLLDLVVDRPIATLILKSGSEIGSFIYTTAEVNKLICDDFVSVCYQDFFSKFPHLSAYPNSETFVVDHDESTWNEIFLDNRKLSSYLCLELHGNNDEILGTLHISNFNNNYFTDSIHTSLQVFVESAGIILHNAILYKQLGSIERDLRQIFSKFIPNEVISELLQKRTTTKLLVGEKREIALFFSDIRSFTTISENNQPEKVVSFLNTYFEKVCSIIQHHGGTVDKFIGDAVLAIFGAPQSWPDNSLRAVRAALEVAESIKTISTGDLVLPKEGFQVGIGLHTGDVILGNIGSSVKFDYTVIGDSVNLASRLEGLTKEYHCPILVSESTVRDCLNSLTEEDHFTFREIENVLVKGKESPTLIFCIDTKTSFPLNFREEYTKGLMMYKMKNWGIALQIFEGLQHACPHDQILNLFITRCRSFQKNPPPADWDCVQRYSTK